MLEQPLPMSSALRASARSIGFLMGHKSFCGQLLQARWPTNSVKMLEKIGQIYLLPFTE